MRNMIIGIRADSAPGSLRSAIQHTLHMHAIVMLGIFIRINLTYNVYVNVYRCDIYIRSHIYKRLHGYKVT